MSHLPRVVVVQTAEGFRVTAVNALGGGIFSMISQERLIQEVVSAIHFARAGSSSAVEFTAPEWVKVELAHIEASGRDTRVYQLATNGKPILNWNRARGT